jgi:hypothetical protein
VGFVENMDESIFMMMIFLKVVYGVVDLTDKMADRSNIAQKREKFGGKKIT